MALPASAASVPPGRWAAFYRALLARRGAGVLAVVLLTAALGAGALRVQADHSVEHLFPTGDPARLDHERYRAQFPHEDARALVLVEAPGLFSSPGLRRLQELETQLARIPGVLDVLGPASASTAARSAMGPVREPLFSPELPAEELARRVAAAREDRLLASNLVARDASAAAILVTLKPQTASSDAGRRQFLAGLRALLAQAERPGERLVASGVPVVKASIVGLLERDTALLVPLAVALVIALLWLAFRSAGAAAAGLFTALVALLWSWGFVGLAGWPATMVLGILPILVVIVSVSDTVHVVADYLDRLRSGSPPAAALEEAMALSAPPCLLTELVLAAGFLSLGFVAIEAVVQFAMCAAAAMLLTWLANALVLPLALAALVRRAPRGDARPLVARLSVPLERFGRFALRRPRAVLVATAALIAASAALATRIERVYYVFDDLRPGSDLAADIRTAERVHGGLVLSAIHVEALGDEPDAALHPELVRLAERASRFLLTLPEFRQANSIADPLRSAHRLLAGDDPEVAGDGLPDSIEGARQELATLGDRRLTRDFLSEDGRSLAVVGRAVDAGSRRIAELYREIDAWAAREQAVLDARPGGPRARLTATGQMRVFKSLNDLLLGGLIGSFGVALLVSFALMALALRSWRLGLVALAPNAAPVLLVFGFMGLTGMALTPVTVMVFSIALVIADDDTLQLLVRFRRRYAAQDGSLPTGEAHRAAVLATLREAGPPMLVTTLAVSLGFLVLLFSEFLGPARLGALTAATLFAAALADLLLGPALLVLFEPLARRKPQR